MPDAAATPIPPNQPSLTPWKVIQTYCADDWEEFIQEWSEGFEPPYSQVVRLGGAGDKGRDIIGYLGDPTLNTTKWDNYQCKHYKNALYPTDAYPELGKLCVYTHRGDYSIPRKYHFVSPCGVGTTLHDLLRKPNELTASLITNWKKYCEDKISDKEKFPLQGSLKTHVENFDFRIVWFLTPQETLNQHQRTKYWSRRFKLDSPKRPDVKPPPSELQPYELIYLTRLYEAYADHLAVPIAGPGDLTSRPDYLDHFKRCRGTFFAAESLSRFSRDQFTPGAFDRIKSQIHSGVVDELMNHHADGFARLQEVVKLATKLQLAANDLSPYVGPDDRKGMCHHLANDGELSWVKPCPTK